MYTIFGLSNVNWAMQTALAKKLLKKYTYSEIIFALNHYKNNGVQMTSLGLLTYKNFKFMTEPVSLYHAELNMQGSDTSRERNKERIRVRETKRGKNDFEYLFTEPDENN